MLGRLYGISHAGSGKHVPQQGASPFVLLFALARLEAHTLCHRLESGKALERNELRSLADALDEKSGQRRCRLGEPHRIEPVRLQDRLAAFRHDESREAQCHRLGIEQHHAVGRSDRKLCRQGYNGEAWYLTHNGRGSAAIAETDVGAVREENALDGTLAGDQQRGLCPTAVELLRFGLQRGAGAGSDRLGAGEHGPCIISAGVRAGSRSGETHRGIEQAVQHVGSREPNGGARDGAEAVAGEMDDRTLRMTDGEASRLLHVGGCKKIDIHSAFDLLTHEA